MTTGKQNKLFYLNILMGVIFFAGCATAIKPRPASSFLFSTKNSTSLLFDEMKKELEKRGYEIKKIDLTAGLFTTQPRKFKINSNGSIVKAAQIFQLRQEGASLKLRITYSCEYSGTGTPGPCNIEDVESQNKISKIERGLLKVLKPIFELNKREVAKDSEDFGADLTEKKEETDQLSKFANKEEAAVAAAMAADPKLKKAPVQAPETTAARIPANVPPAKAIKKDVVKKTISKSKKKPVVEEENFDFEEAEEITEEFESKWGELKEE